MKKRSIQLVLFLALALVLLLAVRAAGADEGAGTQTPQTCRYYYQLVEQTPGTGNYFLYVERTRQEGTPLHTGSLTLAVVGTVSFSPAAGVTTAPIAGTDESGFLPADNRSFVSFFWYWEPGTDLDSTNGTGSALDARRQLLGTVTLPPTLPLEQVELLPWVQAPEGQNALAQWQNAQGALADDYWEILTAVWRMEDPTTPAQGYYQGFYALPDAGGTTPGSTDPEQSQQAVDLTAGWYGFILGSYDPKEPIHLRFYKLDDQGAYPTAPYATAETEAASSGIGYRRTHIDFNTLQITNSDGAILDGGFQEGTYQMVVEKESHVTATFSGLTVTSSVVFPELTGVTVVLPCGDVDENGRIGQKDRALLTQPDRYRKSAVADANGKTLYDLDGDGKVNQTDLSILTAPANYGKRALTYNFH